MRILDLIFNRSDTIRCGAPDKNVSQAERSLRVKSTTESKAARRMSIHAERSRTPRFARNVCRNPWMAGRSGAHSPETARTICAAGECSRKAEIAGVVKMRSPSRRSWISRIFIGATVYGRRCRCWQWLQHLHGHFISPQQSLPKMVPGKIFHYPFARGNAHFRHDSRMLVKMLDRAGDGIDIAGRHYDAFDSITHHIAGFAGDHLRQTAGRRLVSDLGATFQL